MVTGEAGFSLTGVSLCCERGSAKSEQSACCRLSKTSKWVFQEEKSSNVSLKIQGTSHGLTVPPKLSSRYLFLILIPHADASRFGSTYLAKLGFDHSDKNATLGISGVGLAQHLKVWSTLSFAGGFPCSCGVGASQTGHARHRSAAHKGSKWDRLETKPRLRKPSREA